MQALIISELTKTSAPNLALQRKSRKEIPKILNLNYSELGINGNNKRAFLQTPEPIWGKCSKRETALETNLKRTMTEAYLKSSL